MSILHMLLKLMLTVENSVFTTDRTQPVRDGLMVLLDMRFPVLSLDEENSNRRASDDRTRIWIEIIGYMFSVTLIVRLRSL